LPLGLEAEVAGVPVDGVASGVGAAWAGADEFDEELGDAFAESFAGAGGFESAASEGCVAAALFPSELSQPNA